MEKKILVTRSSLPPIEEYIDEIKDIWDSHWLTNMGEKHKALQNGLKEYLGVENIDLIDQWSYGTGIISAGIESAGRSNHDSIYICFNNTCNRNGIG